MELPHCTAPVKCRINHCRLGRDIGHFSEGLPNLL